MKKMSYLKFSVELEKLEKKLLQQDKILTLMILDELRKIKISYLDLIQKKVFLIYYY